MKPTKKAAEMDRAELAAYIDQSVLKPEFTEEDVRRYTQEGIDFGCATVCCNPAWLPVVAPMCEGTGTGVCVVCDFPFGLAGPEAKAALAEMYCSQWDIQELDVVANYGLLRSGDLDGVVADLVGCVEAAHRHGTGVKVIIETDALDLEQVAAGTRCAIEAGADFIKSSTGFYTGGPQKGATAEVVAAMMEAADGKIKVKGSGCIRDKHHFLELVDMGIDRMGIGFRSTPEILA